MIYRNTYLYTHTKTATATTTSTDRRTTSPPMLAHPTLFSSTHSTQLPSTLCRQHPVTQCHKPLAHNLTKLPSLISILSPLRSPPSCEGLPTERSGGGRGGKAKLSTKHTLTPCTQTTAAEEALQTWWRAWAGGRAQRGAQGQGVLQEVRAAFLFG